MTIINDGFELVDIDTVHTHPENPRRGDVNAIRESIRANGFYGSLVCQRKTRTILIGNHRWQAARLEGLKKVPVTWVDVDRVTELRLVVADNRTSDIAENDDADLERLLSEVFAHQGTLTGTCYTDAELDELIADVAASTAADDVDRSEPAPPPSRALREKWQTEEGQIWRAGTVRVACGDAYNAEHRAALIDGAKIALLYTDPPYGIDLVPGSGTFGGKGGTAAHPTRAFDPVAGDDRPFDPSPFLGLAPAVVMWGGNYFADKLPPSRCWFVWDKQHVAERSFAELEMAWTNLDRHPKIYRCTWDGWAKEGESGIKLHPTQKPLKLSADTLTDAVALAGAPVLDVFAGSGSTLVACHRLGLECYGLELSADYLAVILERLSDEGLEPELVGRL